MKTLSYAATICLLFSVLSYLPSLSEGVDVTWTSSSSVNGLQGQSVNMTWTIDLVNYGSGIQWTYVKIYQDPNTNVILYTSTGRRTLYGDFQSREADLTLTASQNGTIVTVVFTMANLNKTTDQNGYKALVANDYPDTMTIGTSTMLTVLVPIAITSPNPHTVTVNETQTAQLLCTATGNPPPSFNWTRNGVTVSTGSPSYTTPATTINDDKTCYTCVAYNGFLEAKTANVCLNVQYKPRNATVLSDKAMVCQNDKVNLTCTSGPANPAPSSYEFYNNGVLVGTSASNVYEATATAGLPDVNKFVCVPRNLLGGSLENGSVEVNATVTPTVTQTFGSTKTAVEGSNLTLACTASGTPPLNVTWTKTGRPDVVGLEYPIIDIKRGDAGLYSCTVNNGAECPSNTATINVTVNYKPESTNLTYTPNNDNFCMGNRISLTCAANANPVAKYLLYRNNQLVQGESTTGVFSNVPLNERGDNTFTCVPNNTAGTGENKSIQIFVKEAPVIATSPQSKTEVEGQSLSLFCNATGLPVPNITWTKVGGSTVGSGETFTIASVVRGDEGSYRCTASNGDECSNATADALVTVNYPPGNTAISTNKSDNTLLKGDTVKLSCTSLSKPQLCNVTFYHGNNIIQSYYGSTCTGAEAASHVITSIDGCNLEEYSCKVENQYGQEESKINLTVKVPATLNTSLAADIVLVEGESLDLNCTATGCPTPNVTWTKTGVSAALVSDTGFFIFHRFNSLSKTDTGNYTCSVDNGVVGSPVERTIYVNVTYKPYLTNLTSTRSNACVNDTVTLECTSDANPPVHEYRFYLNDQLVHTSSSGVYQFNIPQAGNNTYKCEPVNTVGTGQNATVTVPTKAPPQITYVSPSNTFVEGANVVLMCNVTGSDPLNVTWRKDGVSSYPEGSSHTFASIGRGDEATYQCTAHNGHECPVATDRSSVTVIYKPENTVCSTNKSSNVFLQGETVNLTCQSSAKPTQCNVLFSQGANLLANKSSTTCSASYLLTNIQGCNQETLSFYAQNAAGNGDTFFINITVQVPPGVSVTPSSDTIAKEEGHPLSLNCTPTGCPSANVTWTKNGVSSPLEEGNGNTLVKSFTSLTKQDTGTYQCTVDNGVAGSPVSKMIYVNVTYKPYLTNLSSTRSNACVNDTVTLECTADANPPVHEYRFYLNDELVYTSSSSGVYQFNVPQTGNNTYKCEPVNSVGSGENATVTIATKAPPQITYVSPSSTFVEGANVVLMCNVTGSDPLNVTWSKDGVSLYPEGSSYTFASIGRGDEATYQCTAHNGHECPVATDRSSVTVIYKPENTNITVNKSSSVFLLGEPVTLNCRSAAKPSACNVLFYYRGQTLANKSSSTCSSSYLISGIQGCNEESFSCIAFNEAGIGERVYQNVTVQVPPGVSVAPSSDTIAKEEGHPLSLNCTPTGCPSANVTWTKNGVSSPLEEGNGNTLVKSFTSLTKQDTGTYQCTVDNGVAGSPVSKTIYVNVTYKPYLTNLTSTLSNACVNDTVTLECTSDANPPVHEYRFYLNDELVYTSSSGVYQFNVPQAGNNTYKCEPVNTVGIGQNVTVTIPTKVPAQIITITPNKTVVEGDNVVLMCNVTGSDPLNVTWSKVGGSSYPVGSSHTFASIGRGDEATYQCTAHNGHECPVATDRSSVTVIYKPENTNLTVNKSSNVFLLGEPVTLNCRSAAKPSACNVLFYYRGQTLANKSSSTCSSSYLISGIQGCNEESFSCIAFNEAGIGERVYQNVTVQVPPGVSVAPSSDTIAKEEGHPLSLNCTPTGCPSANVTWTKNGVSSPLEEGNGNTLVKSFTSLTKQDTGTYQCTVDNGVAGSPVSKTIYVNVTYKPYLTNLTSTLSNACVNDTVTLECTSDANPPVHEYRFYLNDELVYNSSSGVYQFNIPQAGNKIYKCEPVNSVGSGENATVTVATKAPAQITFITPNKTAVEGDNVVLMCNVTGSDSMNVTWSKVGGPSYPEGSTYTFTSIGRGDEATYQCTAHNGNECPSATARSSIAVIYKPENTNLTVNKSSNVFLLEEPVTLSCQSAAKPSACNVLFYYGDQLLANKSSSTCSASHLIPSIEGCNEESFSCIAFNEAGIGGRVFQNVTVRVPPGVGIAPSSDTIAKEEGHPLSLNCTPTGCPSANVTWTKNGVSSPLEEGNGNTLVKSFTSLTKQDTGTYQCTVDNGVAGSPVSKTIYVNVTYKPYLTNLTSTFSNACVNDTVTLECTTDANPPVHEYRFYLNDELVYTSSSGVYQFNIPQAGNNTYKCEPVNTVGTGQNATVTVASKAPPQITWSSPNQTVVEGDNVVLMCNVTGSDPMNVTWSKVGGPSYPEGSSYTFGSIGRGDEATYQCTAHNGIECPGTSVKSSITVTYRPENTQLSINKTSDILMFGEAVNLTCQSSAKPSHCNILFYQRNQLLANRSSSPCSESLVIPSVQGCNEESFSCVVVNQVGTGTRVYENVTVKSPSTISVVPSTNSVEMEEGNSLILNCSATGCPSPNITWSKDGGAPFSNFIGHQLTHGFGGNLGKQDTGTYKCAVDNGVSGSVVFRTIYVNVTYRPQQTNLTSDTMSTCVNNRVNLSCSSTANPPVIDYLFYLNGRYVHTSSAGIYQDNVVQAGTNVYTCKPRNSLGDGMSANVSIVTKAQPAITFLTGPQTVVEGSRTTIVCNASGSSPLNVTLRKSDGNHIQIGNFLTLPVVNRNDEGSYVCTVNNGNECLVASSTTSVIVNYKPENTNLTASNSSACLGDELTLTCNTHAKPLATTYRFYRNGQLFHETNNTGIYTFTLGVNGTNVYMCQPENDAGNDTTSNPNVTVVVKAAPVITYATPSQQVIEGSSFVLVCNVIDHSGHLNVSWHKRGGGQLSSNSTYTISPVNRNDTGSYECRAHNGNECDAKSRTTTITVTYPATISYYSSVTGTINENDEVNLTCRVAGVPNPTVNWTRNGQLIDVHGETYRFNALESRSANYSCIVSNGIGEVKRRTFNVNIKGHCKDHRCRYGSTCRSEGQGYRCLCTRGLTGQYCEIEDPVHIVFIVILVIENPGWDEEYDNKNSAKFENLGIMICNMMFKICNRYPPAILGKGLVDCKLISARRGSIYTNTELTFNDTLLQSEVLNAIKAAIINETIFGNLTLKKSGLQVRPRTNPCSSEPCKFDSKCIVLDQGYRCDCTAFRYGQHCEKGIGLIPGIIIIIACIMILIIAIILCCLYCKRNKAHTYPSGSQSAEENGTRMQTFQIPDHKSSASNAHVSIQDEKPAVINGQPSETYRQNHGKEDVTYAALSFKAVGDPKNKEKVEKIPEKSDTVYAEIVSFQQNIDKEKPEMKETLDEEATELTEIDQDKPDGDTDIKKIKMEEGQENQAINETAATPDEGGENDTFENQQTNVDSPSPQQNLV